MPERLVLLAVVLVLAGCGAEATQETQEARTGPAVSEPESIQTTETSFPEPLAEAFHGLRTGQLVTAPGRSSTATSCRRATPIHTSGTKNVFASEPAKNGAFPVGTVVVKEGFRPGNEFVGLIATMRKIAGADPEHNDWVFVEWARDDPAAPFTELASGAVCSSCHLGAADKDYVFTSP